MLHELKPEEVGIWLPLAHQQRYARHITGQRELSPVQAGHFVRLWGYSCLKRNGPPYKPIQTLDNKLYDSPFFFSHEDACKLFYADKKNGSSRAAGLMLDKFADDKRKLIKCRRFQGTKTEIRLTVPSEFELPADDPKEEIYADGFNCRKDLLHVTELLRELYSVNNRLPESELVLSIRQGLRNWAKRYPKGLRVIRRASDREAIGFATVMPVASESAHKFCSPPHESLHLSRFSRDAEDPIQIATPDDSDCYIAYIRSWQIHPGLWTYENVLALLEETKKMLRLIHADYPELSEIYSMTIHPRQEEFALTLGFKTSSSSRASALRWLYIHLDTFLELDSESILSQLNLDR